MPIYRSKLFRRNNGGTVTKKPYAKRSKAVVNRAAPRPQRLPVSVVNTAERKQLTGAGATLALKDVGQCFHLDQVTQGTGATQRLGQKYRVTGVHIRGDWIIQLNTRRDNIGYYLVWDRQPNEALANPGDILNLTGTDSIKAFPNASNDGRFQFLARKDHSATTAVFGATAALTTLNHDSVWHIDHFFDLTDSRLIATNVIAGSGLISDRTSGALLMVGIGDNSATVAANLSFTYRVYFEDV